jgi:DNA-binding MarR family transcriptional regulator
MATDSPPHTKAAVLGIMRAADLLRRRGAALLEPYGITVQQYNVLRILRGAGTEGLPTLVIRDRMIHAAPGITRLLDKLEKAGLARRDRSSPDRRQVFCHITPRGLEVLSDLEEEMRRADDFAVGNLSDEEQQALITLLEGVRAGHRRGNAPIHETLTGHGPAAAPAD